MSLRYVPLQTPEEWVSLSEALADGRPRVSVLTNILAYARDWLGAKGAVVENDYVDRDYRDEFVGVYAKCFRSYSDRCARVHFFTRPIRTSRSLPGAHSDYLGFMVIRPVEAGLVGRTVLKPWCAAAGDTVYPLCTAEYRVHLNGVEFAVTGAPFIEQDRMAITCAQASMWMSLRYLSAALGSPLRGPYEVSDFAAGDSPFEQRVVPARGLTWWSMLQGFRKLGFGTNLLLRPAVDPQANDPYWTAGWDPIASVYACVESRMPAIVGFDGAGREGHAMTVVGHIHSSAALDINLALDRAARTDYKGGKSVVSSHEWVQAVLVHDDQTGPYRVLPVSRAARQDIAAGPYAGLLTRDEYGSLVDDVTGVLAPLPDKLYLDATAAEAASVAYLTQDPVRLRIWQAYNAGITAAGELLVSMETVAGDPMVVRSYYMRSSDFKDKLRAEPLGSQMHSTVRTKYASASMPTYIWIVELSTQSRISGATEADRQIVGELVLDATANILDWYPFLFCHLPGVLREFDRAGSWKTPVKEWRLDGDQPYGHHTRKAP